MAKNKKPFNNFPFEYHQPLVVTVESLTNLGDGVARVPITAENGEQRDWVLFIPYALTGERLKVRVIKNGAKSSHTEIVDILEPSPHRVAPKCKVYHLCGGCQYQHISYEQQLVEKRTHVAELLQRLGGVTHEVNAPLASPTAWGYRSKITPHFQKTKNGKIREIGFQQKGGRNAIVDVDYCRIAHDDINAMLPIVREQTRKRAGSYKREETLLLRVNHERVFDNPREIMSEKVGEIEFYFLAGDFFQNNPFILPEFVQYACDQARHGSRYLIDAYCGSGLFGLSLAKDFEQVAMVEVSETGADWARYNAKANGIENVEVMTASAEHIFDDITFPSQDTTVLIDPPRKGCNAEFLTQLFDFGPTRVVYISCDPATQARDLQAFDTAGYRIIDVQPVDLFPQTRHLECIVTLEKGE